MRTWSNTSSCSRLCLSRKPCCATDHHCRSSLLYCLQEQHARVERYKQLLAPFILRRLKSEVATQLQTKKQVVQVRGHPRCTGWETRAEGAGRPAWGL